ncbi:1486_t:CDS:2, partial [Acaulospora colombiana]
MRVRLESLIGEAAVSSLVLDEASVHTSVNNTEAEMLAKAEIKDSFAADIISKAKAKGLTPEQLHAKAIRDQTTKR